VVPVVYEHTASGSVLELAESNAIERYLARKYNLLGSNIWEENLVNQYYHNAEGLIQAFALRVVGAAPEARIDEASRFYIEVLSKFVAIHEERLKQSGDNGHYVGNTTTLADLKIVQTLDRILLLSPKGGAPVPVSKELTPALWKVKETVEGNASYAAWKKSQRSLDLNANTKARFQF
jgi:glutathione S-transferase